MHNWHISLKPHPGPDPESELEPECNSSELGHAPTDDELGHAPTEHAHGLSISSSDYDDLTVLISPWWPAS